MKAQKDDVASLGSEASGKDSGSSPRRSHTPGPWHVHGGGARCKVVDSAGDGISIPCWGRGNTNDAANARLIAAAPTMLAKLKEIYSGMACSCRLQHFVDGPVPCETCQIGNVIAEADGATK